MSTEENKERGLVIHLTSKKGIALISVVIMVFFGGNLGISNLNSETDSHRITDLVAEQNKAIIVENKDEISQMNKDLKKFEIKQGIMHERQQSMIDALDRIEKKIDDKP